MARPLINVPASVKRGQVFEIKTLISHIMETGFRYTTTGAQIPRDIVTTFSCSYNGEEIFSADFYPAISANPFLTSPPWRQKAARWTLKWVGDNGFSETASAKIVVE